MKDLRDLKDLEKLRDLKDLAIHPPYLLRANAPVINRDAYRGISLIRKRIPVGSYRSNMPRALWLC